LKENNQILTHKSLLHFAYPERVTVILQRQEKGSLVDASLKFDR